MSDVTIELSGYEAAVVSSQLQLSLSRLRKRMEANPEAADNGLGAIEAILTGATHKVDEAYQAYLNT